MGGAALCAAPSCSRLAGVLGFPASCTPCEGEARVDCAPSSVQARAGGGAGGGAKVALAGAVQLFRELSASASNTITGRSDEQDEDPQYLQVRARTARPTP